MNQKTLTRARDYLKRHQGHAILIQSYSGRMEVVVIDEHDTPIVADRMGLWVSEDLDSIIDFMLKGLSNEDC